MTKHETEGGNYLAIDETDNNFDTWLNKPYISSQLKEQLSKTDIMFVPIESFGGVEGPCFPVKTEEMFSYFKANLSSDQKVKTDICIEEKDYKELALHSDLFVIGTFVVGSVVLPIFINVLSSYISEKVLKPRRADNIKLNVTVVKKEGDSKCFEYEGSAQDFINGFEEINKLGE